MVYYLGDNEIPVIQRDVVEVDQDVVVPERRDSSLIVEFEAVEVVFALNDPLLGR